MWTARNQKLHDPTNTSSPTSDLDADIVNYYANPQTLAHVAAALNALT